MRLWLALLALVSIAAWPAYAELLLSGRIVDENNVAVEGARVTFHLAGTPETQVYSAVSDPTGAFSLPLPAPGQYLINITHEGFFPLHDFAVDVTPSTPEVHLILNHARELFQSVKVSATPQTVDVDQTSSERKLSGLEILNVPYQPTRDLRKALELMPGVVQDSTGALHFDGGAENQTLYMLDGFNISDPLTGRLDTRLSVEAVRSIDWATGRYSPEFGKGSAGALAIQTDMGTDQWRYSATNFVPGIDTQKGLHIGTWAPRLNLSGPIDRGRAWFSDNLDGIYSVLTVPDLPAGQDRTRSFQGSNLLRTQVNVTPSNIFFGSFLTNYQFAPQQGLSALSPLSTTTDERSRTWFFSAKDQMYLSRGMLLEIGYAEDRTFLRLIPQGHQFYEITPYGNKGNNYTDSRQFSRRGQFLVNLFLPSFELGGHHQIKTGIDVDRLGYSQDIVRTGYQIYDVAGNLVRQTTFGGSGKASEPGLEASWYVVDNWKLKPDLVLEAGVRQDWDELVRRAVFSPRTAFSWAPFESKHTKISGGYAIVRDATNLETFIRPRDQYGIDTYYNPDGTIYAGPELTVFEILNRRQLQMPRYQNWTAGLEQRLPANIDLTATYLRKRGNNGFTYNNLLPGIPPSPALISLYGTSSFDYIYNLTNSRRDIYDSFEIAAHQRFREQYEWMASYTRSRTLSNVVIDPTVDEPLQILNNVGPLSWDAPNRLLSWGYLPTFWQSWAIAYAVDAHTGFPYSVVNGVGQITGPINSQRFPFFLDLAFHVEWKFHLFGHYWALRGGFDNITDHNNPTLAQTIPGQPVHFLGSEGRHFVVRLRWLKQEKKKKD